MNFKTVFAIFVLFGFLGAFAKPLIEKRDYGPSIDFDLVEDSKRSWNAPIKMLSGSFRPTKNHRLDELLRAFESFNKNHKEYNGKSFQFM